MNLKEYEYTQDYAYGSGVHRSTRSHPCAGTS